MSEMPKRGGDPAFPKSTLQYNIPKTRIESTQPRSFVYRTFMRRSSTFAASLVGIAIVTQFAFDKGIDKLWRVHNRGKLFEDMISKFPETAEE